MPCGTHRHHRHSCRRHAGLCGVAASTSHVVGGGGLPAIACADLPTPPVSAFLSHQRSPCWPPAASDATRAAPASLCCQPSTAPASLGPSSRASYPLYPATINAGLPHRRAQAMEGALGSGRRATNLAVFACAATPSHLACAPTPYRPATKTARSGPSRLHLHLPSPSARRPHLTPLHCWRRFMSSTASILAPATTLASLRPSSTFGSAPAGSRVFDAASPAAVVLASRRLCWPLA